MRLSSLPLRPAALVALLLLSLPARAQGWEWARSGGGSERNAPPGDIGRGVTLDADGNLYVTGYFYGTATFGDFTLTSAGAHDVFLVKYTPAGDVLWAWSGGGSEDDLGARVAVSADGSVFLATYFRQTATFGAFSLTSVGQVDVALLKFSPDGEVLWVRSGGGTDVDACYHVSVDAAGDVYITGRFGYPSGAPATFGDFTLTSAGSYDVFLVKYSPEGDVLWAWSAGGPWADRGYSLSQDADGNTYLTGRFGQTATFGPFTLTSAGANDAFLVKLSPEGDVLWARSGGGPDVDSARDLALDDAGNVYVAGRFGATATFGDTTLVSLGGTDAFLVKYSPEGEVLWARRSGGGGNDWGYGVAVDVSGNAYVTGYFRGTATFGDFALTSAGAHDVFLVKYAADGTVRWAQRAGGNQIDIGHGVAVDAGGYVYVSGYFNGTMAFGPHTLTSAGGNDMFLAKYDPHSPVTVAAAPVSPPVVVGPGIGTFDFTVTLSNTTPQPQTFQVWTAVTGPANRKPVYGPVTVTLPARVTVTRTLWQQVPGIAPAGTYTYHVGLGSYPVAVASASFPFEKVAGAAAEGTGGAEAWLTSGWGEAEASAEAALPGGFALSEARPNPFTRQATLTLEVAEAQHVTAEVLDALGRRVAVLLDGPVAAGAHALVVEAGALPSGRYVVRVAGERFSATRRLALVR